MSYRLIVRVLQVIPGSYWSVGGPIIQTVRKVWQQIAEDYFCLKIWVPNSIYLKMFYFKFYFKNLIDWLPAKMCIASSFLCYHNDIKS